jgi:hypothetical protein
LGRQLLDSRVDRVAIFDDERDDVAGELGGLAVALGLGQVTLENCRGGALTEVRFE